MIVIEDKSYLNLQQQVAKNTEDIAALYGYDPEHEWEETSNKVTTISNASTDTQYPSAKAAYTYGQTIKSSVESQVPHYTSQLTNDSGYLTSHQSLSAYRTAADQDIIDQQWQRKVPGIDDMATKTWVGQQGFLTQHQSLAAYRTSAAQDVIDGLQDTAINSKSTVSVAETGSATTEAKYITVNGTEYKLAAGGIQSVAWGDITGTLSNQTDLQTALDTKCRLEEYNSSAASYEQGVIYYEL